MGILDKYIQPEKKDTSIIGKYTGSTQFPKIEIEPPVAATLAQQPVPERSFAQRYEAARGVPEQQSWLENLFRGATALPYGIAAAGEQAVAEPLKTAEMIARETAKGYGRVAAAGHPGLALTPQALQARSELTQGLRYSPFETGLELAGMAVAPYAAMGTVGKIQKTISPKWNALIDVAKAKLAERIPARLQRALSHGGGRPKWWLDLQKEAAIEKARGMTEIADIAAEAKGTIPREHYREAYRQLDPTALEGAEFSYKLTPEGFRKVSLETLDKLAPEEQQSLFNMRRKITDMGWKAVNEGVLPEDIFRKNLDNYLRRYYTKHEAGKGAAKMTRKFRIEGGWLKKRKVVKPEPAGLIVDPVYAFAKSMGQMTHDLEMFKLFRKTAEHIGGGSDVPLAGYSRKALPNTNTFGALKGKHVPKEIYADIMEIGRISERGEIAKLYDKALSLWKLGKTAYNPSTHARNIFSNMILADLADVGLSPFNPASYKFIFGDMVKDYAKKGKWYREASTNTELLSGDWYGGEIKPHLIDKANVGDPITRSFDIAASGWLGKIAKSPADLYQLEEQIFKMAVYAKKRMAGASIADAADHAEKFLFNYSKVSPFISKVRRLPIGSPFVTFTHKAVPLVLETAIRKPWKVGKYFLLAKGLQELSEKAIGLTDKESQEIKQNRRTNGTWQVLVPVRDQEGRPLLWDLTYSVPWGDLAEADWFTRWMGVEDNPWLATPTHLAARYFGSNPLFKGAIEMFGNRNLWTDRELISKSKLEEPETAWKERLQYLWTQATPPLTPGNYAAQALYRAALQKPSRFGEKRGMASAAAQYLLGTKVRPASIERLQQIRQGDAYQIIEDLKRRIRSTWLDRSLSEDEKRKQIKFLRERIVEVGNRYRGNTTGGQP